MHRDPGNGMLVVTPSPQERQLEAFTLLAKAMVKLLETLPQDMVSTDIRQDVQRAIAIARGR